MMKFKSDGKLHARGDNEAAGAMYGSGFSDKLAAYERVINLRIAFRRDVIQSGLAVWKHMPEVLCSADMLTKSLGSAKMSEARTRIGMTKKKARWMRRPRVRLRMDQTSDEERETEGKPQAA